ncbi:MAG: glutamate-1-semialdehyde 2,1-aminomutase [Desulfovibrionaceae bacterium]
METLSQKLFATAEKIIPGGVNSPVRACKNVDSIPLFIKQAEGCHLTDVDGNQYIDYVLSWGPMILGHAHPVVTQAVALAAARGTSYGAPCEDEVLLAQAVLDAMPAMSALRLARGVTGRHKLIKFVGCYHGHADAFLAAAGSGLATLSIPGTPGVPEAVVQDTLLAPYNDLAAVQTLFDQHGKDIAAVIVEPTAANMGLVPALPGFLEGLRTACDQHGALLIFDEVITGFRLGYGGAQGRFGITPDLTTLGKIIGGGLPVGAYGGKAQYMREIAPSGHVYQAGTLSGNPLAMAAGLATLSILKASDYVGLEQRTAAFAHELESLLRAKKVPVRVHHVGAMFCPFFTDGPVTNFDAVKKASTTIFTSFYKQMRAHGVYMAPAAFETGMTSFAHSENDFAKTLEAVRKVKL